MCGLLVIQNAYIHGDYYSSARPVASMSMAIRNDPPRDPLQEFRQRMNNHMMGPPHIRRIPQSYQPPPPDFDPSVPPLLRHAHPEARNEYAGKTDSILPSLHAYFQNCSPDDFKEYFDRRQRDGQVHSDYEILEHHNLYQYSNFTEFIRTLDCYESYILNLEHLHGDQPDKKERYKARHKVKHTEGFRKSGFAFWVAREAERIQEHRKRANQEIDEVNNELSHCQKSQHIDPQVVDELFENMPVDSSQRITREHEENIAYFQGAQEDESASPDVQDQAKLGEEYASWCERTIEQDTEQYHRYATRAALLRTALGSTTHEHRSYDVSSQLQKQLQKHDIDHEEWQICDGTIIQHHVHRELLTVADDVARIDRAFGNDMYAQHMAAFVYRFGDLAHEHKKLNNIRVAYSLSDFCYGMRDACVNVAHHLRGAYLYTPTVVNAIEHIATRSLDILARRAGKITTHIKEHPLVTAGELVGFAVVPYLMLAKTCFDLYQSREALGTLLGNFKETCSSDPAEATAETIAFLVEILAVGTAPHKCISLIKKGQGHAMYFAKAAARESKVAQHLNKMGKQAAQNIELMAAQSMETLNIAMKKGIDATRKALVTLAENQEFVLRKSLRATELISFFAAHPVPLCEINWKHILYPVIETNRKTSKVNLSGYHIQSIIKYPTEIIKNIDRTGVTVQKYFYKGHSKVSTFFPKSWTERTLIENIKAAYNNVQMTHQNGFVGLAPDGTYIQFILRKSGPLNTAKKTFVHSVYPFHFEDLPTTLKGQ